jgi:2-polyprenyl-3-methyl-5-hydroxy-6-metoxy-1,4-benzoquinol methylase
MERFIKAYNSDSNWQGKPPWDIGGPQPAFREIYEKGLIHGEVLDSGCGTGENALFLAGNGLQVTGLDIVPAAIEKAKEKALQKGLSVNFQTGDALNLQELGKKFDTIIDSGVFHIFSDEDRVKYVNSLNSALKPGGTYFMECFSDQEPAWSSRPEMAALGEGPRRVSQKEIQESFAKGWKINFIEAVLFDVSVFGTPNTVKALLSSITKL